MFVKTCLSNPLILLFILPLFLTTAFSQNTSYLDSLDGKFALQFQISENFNLSSFQGTVFSGKYNFSSRDAVRLGLSINFGDTEEDNTGSRSDTNLVSTARKELNSFNFVVKTQYIYSMSITNDIGFFIGGGPFISYTTSSSESKWLANQVETMRTYTSDIIGIGLDLINGVEWMFSKNMSLSAEYGLKFNYTSSEEKRVSENTSGNYGTTEESNRKSFLITGNHINFGITVYF
ncbi:MAG: hypothetical protein DRQ13_07810 [Ignavibacteriae bacterium]|nr:MAG: hypothetical protein DRQ13_07810 [Ignavibacteriota bacterium]